MFGVLYLGILFLYLSPGYDYSGRYPGSEYMRSAGDYYGMGGYGEGRAAAGAGYAAAGYGAYRYPGYMRAPA